MNSLCLFRLSALCIHVYMYIYIPSPVLLALFTYILTWCPCIGRSKWLHCYYITFVLFCVLWPFPCCFHEKFNNTHQDEILPDANVRVVILFTTLSVQIICIIFPMEIHAHYHICVYMHITFWVHHIR